MVYVALAVRALSVGALRREIAEFAVVNVVHVEHGGQAQPLDERVASLGRGERARHMALVGIDLVFLHEVHVVELLDVSVVGAIIVVDGYGWREHTLQGIHGVAVICAAWQRLLPREREQSAHGQVEPLVFVAHVDVSAISLKSGVARHVLLVGIVERTGKLCAFRTSHGREVVVLLQRFPEQRLLPVGVSIGWLWRIPVYDLLGVFLGPLHSLSSVDVGVGQAFENKLSTLVATHRWAEVVGKV